MLKRQYFLNVLCCKTADMEPKFHKRLFPLKKAIYRSHSSIEQANS